MRQEARSPRPAFRLRGDLGTDVFTAAAAATAVASAVMKVG